MQPPPLDSSALPTDEVQRGHRALLAKLRHDLRTPLNAIIGYSQILIEDAQDGNDARLLPNLAEVCRAGEGLLAQVNDILGNEKISAGELDADLEAVAAQLQYQLRTPAEAILSLTEQSMSEARQNGQQVAIPDLEKIHTAAHKFIDAIGDIVQFPLIRDAVDGSDHAAAQALVKDAVNTLKPLDEVESLATHRGSILIVDDSPINRDILAQRLTRQGHTVRMAEDGRHALQLIRENPFDLILLDILMPELNGYQVLQALKADKEWREVPVIMISALDELDSVVRCIQMGAEDYLPKPFNPVLLKARIDSSLEKKHLRDRQRELFRTFATKEVAEELLTTGFSLGGKYVDATAMFSDIRSFTTLAEAQVPADTITLLNNYFSRVMGAIGSEGGIVNQMVGDGLMAIFGAPLPRSDHCERAVRAALKMMERIEEFNREQQAANKPVIQIGIGIASGEVIAGYAGTEMRATYTCVGDTVNLASRLQDHTKVIHQPILIDERTRRGLGDQIRVEERGAVQLKGKMSPVRIFSVPPRQDV